MHVLRPGSILFGCRKNKKKLCRWRCRSDIVWSQRSRNSEPVTVDCPLLLLRSGQLLRQTESELEVGCGNSSCLRACCVPLALVQDAALYRNSDSRVLLQCDSQQQAAAARKKQPTQVSRSVHSIAVFAHTNCLLCSLAPSASSANSPSAAAQEIPLSLDDEEAAVAPAPTDLPATITTAAAPSGKKRRERLSEELKRQRRAQLAAQGLRAPDSLRAAGEEEDVDVDTAAWDQHPLRRGSSSSSTVRKQRVDLYINESGYPQAREADDSSSTAQLERPQQQQQQQQGGKQHIHHRNRQFRREHLAPPPHHEDALSALTMERPALPRRQEYDRAHNRPVRFGNGGGGNGNGKAPRQGQSQGQRQEYDLAAPVGVGFAAPQSQRTGQRPAFSSRFGSDAGGTVRGRPSTDRQTVVRRAAGGPSGGPGSRGRGGGGPPQRRSPSALAQQRRRANSHGNMTVPARQLPPPPTSVLRSGGSGAGSSSESAYVLAGPVRGLSPSAPSVDLRHVLDDAHWRAAKADITSAVGAEGIGKIRAGDWEKYLEKVRVQPAKGKARSGVQQDMRAAALAQAQHAMELNGSFGLKGKLELKQKLESSI